MRHHPANAPLGYAASGVCVCAACAKTVATSFLASAVPVTRYDDTLPLTCGICEDVFAGPRYRPDAPRVAPGLDEPPDLSIGDDE